MSKYNAYICTGIQQLATRELDDAMQSFQTVLSEKPTNVIALLGKVLNSSSFSTLPLNKFH